MNGYIAFLKKEYREQARSHRMLLLGLIFLLLGLSAPPVAKYGIAFLENLMQRDNAIAAQTSALGAWTQFHTGVVQLGFPVLLILFCGALSAEYNSGSLRLLLPRGLSREAVLLAKLTVQTTLWTASLMLSFGAAAGYTAVLFPGEQPRQLLFAVSCLWLAGAAMLALCLLCGTVFRSFYMPLLLTLGVSVAAVSAERVTTALVWNPARLTTETVSLLQGTLTPRALLPAVLVTVVCMVLSILLALLRFRRVEI